MPEAFRFSDLPQAFIKKLRVNIKGSVSFDEGARALYATDASNYRQAPIGVVVPQDTQDVIQAVAIAREYGIPLLCRGGGTSLAGQCCNAAIVLDFSRHMNRVVEIDSNKKTARVEPGLILDDLKRAAKPYGLTFGPDPATHNRCTLGGMIGNNACGVHSVRAGKTVDNIDSLEILTYDGLRMTVGRTPEEEFNRMMQAGGRPAEIYRELRLLAEHYGELVRKRYPRIPRRVSGFNLDELLSENGFHLAKALVGSEGTCVTILEATVKLIEDPPHKVLIAASYPDVFLAGDDVPLILSHGPSGLEGLDAHFIRNMRKKNLHPDEIAMMPEGQGWLLIEFDANDRAEALRKAENCSNALKKEGRILGVRIYTEPADQLKVWAVRESTFGASVFVPGEKDTYAGFEDSAVPPEKIGNYLRDLDRLLKGYGYDSVIYGHFGDGCIHARISFDLRNRNGIQTYRAFLDEASDLVLAYGGSFSGEHGDGQAWGELLHKMFGGELVEAFRKFKSIWDPQGKMNPGKIVDAYKIDENLKLESYAAIAQPPLHFQYPDDDGNFSRTTERCIGLGKCLKKDAGTMCPSYMVTGDEKHSTRGRAHLLHEMVRGEIIQDGWKSAAVKEALDLCLSCKACKSECPVGVDMAAYKAEFLSHFYEGKIRPVQAYLFGNIDVWARLAAKVPGISNFMMGNPLLGGILKKISGIAQERQLPVFAHQTFRDWFRNRPVRSGQGRPQVMLWVDTFMNYFYPEIGYSAVRVLEYLGYEVIIPPKPLCCGRPLYDFGMLDAAKKKLRSVLDSLTPDLAAGVPVVGLEPGCVSVFRDEMVNLMPKNPQASALKRQTFFWDEFIFQNHEKELKKLVSKDSDRILVHGHCHQKALLGMKSISGILSTLQFPHELLDSGCCGMAGSFGFDKDHQDVSRDLAERVLLKRLREKKENEVLLTDGFSCREQVRQLAGYTAVHSAELISRILNGGMSQRAK